MHECSKWDICELAHLPALHTNKYTPAAPSAMANCVRCGSSLGDFDAGGNQICANCEAASGHGSGTPTDVPCQRCGMYLPPHELRMWNSRLYCSYCIMDVQDEEKMGREKHRPSEQGDGPAGGISGGGENLPQGSKSSSGTCERCGRQTDTLYSLSGRRVCSQCYSEGGAGTGAGSDASIISQIITKAREALGMEPKILENTSAHAQPAAWPKNSGEPSSPAAKFKAPEQTPHEKVFSIKNRGMVWKDEEKSESEDGSAIGSTGGNERRENVHSEKAPDVFNVRERKMVEKKSDIESSEPISEGKHSEKSRLPRQRNSSSACTRQKKAGRNNPRGPPENKTKRQTLMAPLVK